VTGYFAGTVDFDPAAAAVDNLTSNQASKDFFLSKFDSSGNYQWARTWGSYLDDSSFGVAVDGLGKAYITGYFNGQFNFDPVSGVDYHRSIGIEDAFLIKVMPDGYW
jgi:hypothetical protein